jgi:hypothetical protein
MTIGFTGTHIAITDKQKERLIRLFAEYKPTEVHHGGCICADEYCHKIAKFMKDCKIIVHPPINKKAVFDYSDAAMIMPEMDYIDRNHVIVSVCDLLIAMPNTEQEVVRSGTWATIRYARKLKKVIVILEP